MPKLRQLKKIPCGYGPFQKCFPVIDHLRTVMGMAAIIIKTASLGASGSLSIKAKNPTKSINMIKEYSTLSKKLSSIMQS